MTGPHRHKHKPIGAAVTLEFLRERTTLDLATGCWLWTGAVARNGYGIVRHGAKTTRTHRLAYILASGLALPRSIDVCHRCDVRACINPDHLFHGTRADNMRDCASKGRIRTPVLAGDDCPASKLTSTQVFEIRSTDRTSADLAAAYGVSTATIKDVRRGHTWKTAAGRYGPRPLANQTGAFRLWTTEEDQAIQRGADLGVPALSRLLSRTAGAVRQRAQRLGAPLRRTYKSRGERT